MRKITKYLFPCLILAAVCLLNGCKSTKIGGDSTSKVNTKALKEFVSSMQQQELKFKTLSARLNADLDMGDKQLSSRVEMKLVRDSALQLSIQPFLGIEVFRIELTPDSVKVMDRMNKRYVIEGYSAMKNQMKIDFNFYNLQALFINHLFLPGEQEVDGIHYDQFHLEREGVLTRLHTRDRMKMRYCFEADSEEKLLSTTITEATGRYSLSWKYDEFEFMQENQLFPHLMRVSFCEEGIRKGGMAFSYSRIQLNKKIKMDFNISSKYKRITLSDIMKMMHK